MTWPNNSILERLNGTFSERTKVMRSLDADLTANEFTDRIASVTIIFGHTKGLAGRLRRMPAGLL